MASITAIRQAIADTLLDVYGPDGPQAELGVTVTAQIEGPNCPHLWVLKGITDYGEAMGGSLNRYDMIVRALLEMPADVAAQDLLDDMLSFEGPLTDAPTGRSIKSAIEVLDDDGETTMGGSVGSITVLNSTGHRIYTIGGQEYLGADFACEVWA